MAILQAEAAMHAVLEMQAKLRLKTGFAFSHLEIATRSARDAHAIEQANVGAEFGPWFDGMTRLVPVSIVMAGAALEASANELLQDILDGSTQHPLTPSRRKLLEELKDDRSGNAPVKFKRLGLLMDTNPDTGTEPWRNANLLVKFRNEFMHFRPSWDDDDIHSGGFVEELRKKIRIVDAYKINFLFPYGFMTYDCARWAVQTVLAFSADFSKLIGVKDKFTLPGLHFALP